MNDLQQAFSIFQQYLPSAYWDVKPNTDLYVFVDPRVVDHGDMVKLRRLGFMPDTVNFLYFKFMGRVR